MGLGRDTIQRASNTLNEFLGYEATMNMTQPEYPVYCDAPYNYSQAIVYGLQSFRFC